MVFNRKTISGCIFSLVVAANLSAAPQLRLTQTALGPFIIPQGSNGTAQLVDTANAGDGTLNLQVSSSASWLAATVGSTHPCSLHGLCIPVDMALQTSSLAAGSYTGIVTVSDPKALDSPQTITVTIQVGSDIPAKFEFFVPPGGKVTSNFTAASKVNASATTATGGPWLSVAAASVGSFTFSNSYTVTSTALASLATGDYTGTVTVSGSSSAADNRAVPATMHITTLPVAQLGSPSLTFAIAAGSVRQSQFAAVSNAGQGTLSITSATAVNPSGQSWLSASVLPNSTTIQVNADPGSLTPGTYDGSVTIASNGANASIALPVELEVPAAGKPQVTYQGAVNNATFLAGDAVAPGDIMAVFGSQFSQAASVGASKVPLPTDLGGTEVLVNGQPTPLYYSSYGQVNFQLPFETPLGLATVTVQRNGQAGNLISLTVDKRAPRMLPIGVGSYAIIINSADGSFPMPATPGLNSHPAKVGDVLVIYVIGGGPTTPVAATGDFAPSSPLANVVPPYQVHFDGGLFDPGVVVPPQFSGLSPCCVGLYQVNVAVPAQSPKGSNVALTLNNGEAQSNTVRIAVQ